MPIDIEHDNVEIALKKLKARENSLRQLEAISGMGSWEVDLKTRKSIWSDQSYINYGLDKATTEPTYETFLSAIVPQDLPLVQKSIAEGIASKKVVHIVCQLKKGDGTIATFSLYGQALYDEHDKPIKLIGTTQDITESIKLKKHAEELSKLIEYSSSEIYVIDYNLNYLYVNEGATNALGYSREELLTMNTKDINPYMDDENIHFLQDLLNHTHHTLNRTVHKRKDGSLYDVQSYLHTLTYKGKEAYAIFDTDISEIIELETKHKKQAKILEFIHDSIIATDIEGNITNWNKGSSSLFGYTKEEMLGKNILSTYDEDNEYTLEELFTLLNIQGNLDIEAYMTPKNAKRIICDISLSIAKDDYGNVDGYVGYIQDITAQKKTKYLLEQQTKKLKYQAHHDTLTDLPNRTLFKDRLSQAILSAKRNHEKFALLFIDLDQFKKINDTLGHDVGDDVLIEAANRLQSAIREEDTLARLGGDEFCIIIKNVQNIRGASTVAQKIVDSMQEAIEISTHTLYVTSSIGISIYPDDATVDNDLIKHADVAMYRAKEEGRNNFQFYASEMSAYVFERVVMESSLRIAIEKEEFVVYFQPQYDIKSGAIVGMEALVRWQHPSLGLVAPIKFIPIAEESGLIIDIDRIVMKKAMAQFALWKKEGLHPGVLSLNLAMKQLAQEDFLSYLIKTMKEMHFQSSWLELEVTEGQVMANPEQAIKKLNQINAMGIEIAIDDFGTGYSSLSYLKKLPLDKLKIDQSFVKDIPKDEDDMAITKAIIALGQSLNLKIIAEGVETQEQKEFLAQNGCDLIQGFFYSRPIPAHEITELLESTQTSTY